jgi:hypothetical protein
MNRRLEVVSRPGERSCERMSNGVDSEIARCPGSRHCEALCAEAIQWHGGLATGLLR